MTNVPEGPVQSDKIKQAVQEALDNLNDKNLLEKFTKHISLWPDRAYLLRVISGEARKKTSYEMLRYEGTIDETRSWLDMVEAVAKELGVQPSIGGDYDGALSAYFLMERDFTDEEKEHAQRLLDALGPEVALSPIKWRRPIPFDKAD